MHRTLSSMLVGLSLLCPSFAWAQATLENPAPGSFQNGIGAVSGWKCTGGTLTFTIDNGPPAQLAYGTSRLDTQSVCGHSNTGFGALFNWNLVGDSQHTIQVFDNGVQFAQATFTVKTLGHQFLPGLSGQGTVVNFDNQINVTVQWQESCQCFVIVDTTAAIRLGPPTGTDLGSSLPLCEQPDAGRKDKADAIEAFAQQFGYLHHNVQFCAVSTDNPRPYVLSQGSQVPISGNAFSIFPTGPIFYDVTLLNEFDGIDEFGSTFVLAHELGHQIQFDNLSRVASLTRKQIELQADCFGGIYFGHLIVTDPAFMAKDVMGIAEGICGIAAEKGFNWANFLSHGVCEERVLSFAKGVVAEFFLETNHQTFDPFLVCSF